jgi:ribose transport system ATP-binding protein
MHPKSVGEALKKWRVAYVTENRQEEGLFLTHSLARNVAATTWSHLRGRFGLLSGAGEARLAERYRGELGIRSSGVSVAVSSLSGGNQQKVSIAKWLAADPEVLIFDEPTVGIDIRTKYELHDVIRKRAEQGRGTIVISSDLAEVVQLADRVLLFRSGDIVGSMLNTHAYDEMSAEIMQAILGGAAESAFTAGSDGLRAGRAKAGEGQE